VVRELEDLVPAAVAIVAARNYAVKVVEVSRDAAEELVESDIARQLPSVKGSVFDALAAAFAARFGEGAHIEKVGFAKEVVAALTESRLLKSRPEHFARMEGNFGLLLAELARRLRSAAKEEDELRLNNRLNRTIEGFLADHPTPPSKERGKLLVEEIEASVDDTAEADRVRLAAARLRRDFTLDESLSDPIGRFDEFRERVEALRYESRFMNQEAQTIVEPTLGTEIDNSTAPTGAPAVSSVRERVAE
jgi:hypothetical protein